mgnify:CR=1 FL=1
MSEYTWKVVNSNSTSLERDLNGCELGGFEVESIHFTGPSGHSLQFTIICKKDVGEFNKPGIEDKYDETMDIHILRRLEALEEQLSWKNPQTTNIVPHVRLPEEERNTVDLSGNTGNTGNPMRRNQRRRRSSKSSKQV